MIRDLETHRSEVTDLHAKQESDIRQHTEILRDLRQALVQKLDRAIEFGQNAIDHNNSVGKTHIETID
jgi:hypothetical protein